jgi:hypothetical protein
LSHDPVKHPSHYTSKVPGIECIQVTQHFNFNQGNVIKYVWRCGEKGNPIQDLEKARQYLDFEIARMKAETPAATAPSHIPHEEAYEDNWRGLGKVESTFAPGRLVRYKGGSRIGRLVKRTSNSAWDVHYPADDAGSAVDTWYEEDSLELVSVELAK